jgi:hypothetical protein
MRFYLGVHKFAPVAATRLEFDWLDCRDQRWLSMLRLMNRISTMEDYKLPKIILEWDKSMGVQSWFTEVQYIVSTLGLNSNIIDGELVCLTEAYNKLLERNRNMWHLEAEKKPKLRTYIRIHDFDSKQTLLKANLTRYQRSLLSQLKFGILPLKLETDRYQGIPIEQRICKICDIKSVEDEPHFLFICPALAEARRRASQLYENTNIDLNDPDHIVKMTCMFQRENLTINGQYIEILYRERQKIINR